MPAQPAPAQTSPVTFNAIVLAAGKGTRMYSDRAKVLHEAAGLPLVAWMHRIAGDAGAGQVVVVVGHQADEVAAALPSDTATGSSGRATRHGSRRRRRAGAPRPVRRGCRAPRRHAADPPRDASPRSSPPTPPPTPPPPCSPSTSPTPPATAGWCATPRGAVTAIVEHGDATDERAGHHRGQHLGLRLRPGAARRRRWRRSPTTTSRASTTSPTSSGCWSATATWSAPSPSRRRRGRRGQRPRPARRRRGRAAPPDQHARGWRPGCSWRTPPGSTIGRRRRARARTSGSAGDVHLDGHDHGGRGRRAGPVGAHRRHHHRRRGPGLVRRGRAARRSVATPRWGLRQPPPGHRARRRVQGGHLRRDQEHRDRRGRQGAAPLLRRRRRRSATDANIGAGTITANYDGHRKHRTMIGDGVQHRLGHGAGRAGRGRRRAYTGAGSVITSDVAAGALASERSPQRRRCRATLQRREDREPTEEPTEADHGARRAASGSCSSPGAANDGARRARSPSILGVPLAGSSCRRSPTARSTAATPRACAAPTAS